MASVAILICGGSGIATDTKHFLTSAQEVNNYTDRHANIHEIISTWHIICNSPSSGWIPKSPDASRGMLPNQPHALCKNILWTRKHKLADMFWKNQTIWSPWRLFKSSLAMLIYWLTSLLRRMKINTECLTSYIDFLIFHMHYFFMIEKYLMYIKLNSHMSLLI
jgi:hypothetical protein